jgi:transcriptional regulator with XRE-family HTH domain
VNDTGVTRAAARVSGRLHHGLAEDIDRLRADAGLSVTALGRASGMDPGYLYRIIAGTERPSLQTYARLAVALGADLTSRFYPNTGALVRDRHQARMLEVLLGAVHPRWQVHMEVAVRRPSRGWIDAALHEPRERVLVAAELQSELRRLEQLVRWSGEKAASLPSWDGWAQFDAEPRTSQLLLVRRTPTTRAAVAEFALQLRVAFPAHPDDALAALTGTAPWPGAALVWVATDGRGARLVAGSRW